MPVRAIGARAILDFPDEVNFGTCPVKVKRMNLKFKLVMHCTSRAENNGQQVAGHDDWPNIF